MLYSSEALAEELYSRVQVEPQARPGRFPSSKKLTNVSCLILSRFDEVKIRGESDEVKRTCVCLFTGFPTEIEDRVSIEREIS